MMLLRNILLITIMMCCLKSRSQFTYVIDGLSSNIYQLDLGAGCKSTFIYKCPIRNVSDIAKDAAGNFYISTSDSLYKLDPSHNLTNLGKLPLSVNSLTIGPDGSLYMGSKSVFRYDPGSNTYTNLGALPTDINAAGDMVFYKGELYLSANDGYLYLVNRNDVSNSTQVVNMNARSVFGLSLMAVNCSDDPVTQLRLFAFESIGDQAVAYMIDIENKLVFPGYCKIPLGIAGSNSDILPANISSSFGIKSINTTPAACIQSNDGSVSFKLDLPADMVFSISVDGNPAVNTSIITGLPAGNHRFQIMNQFGCSLDTIISIGVTHPECTDSVFVPTAFTPNADGRNDEFKAKAYLPVKNFEMMIYNRYGQLLFRSNSIFKGWDGKWKGILQSSNTYVWQVRYTSFKGNYRYMKGSLQLIR